jgi:hypothetical protein
MNAVQIFVTGIAPDHIPALLAPFVLLIARMLGPRLVTPDRQVIRDLSGIPLPTKVFAGLMMISAAVHVALPLGHHDNLVLAAAFLGSGVAYAWLGYRALNGKRYRLLSVLLILATLVAYLSIVLSGREAPDQVGIATALVELGALALCLVTEKPRRVRKVFGSLTFIVVTLLTGALTWGGALAQHSANGAGGVNHVGHAGHDHAGGARAQAGVLMAPHDDSTPATPAQVRGAIELAARTRAALARYTDIHAAIAAGYTATINRTGYGVHLENKAYAKDDRILDAEHPEQLMYAIADGKATLLSAVYTVPYAGRPAPSPGGPLTHWHSHNICITVLPPGFSIVDAYGTCPSLAVKLALPLMMHVWVVDNPGGPYVDGEPDTWTRAFNLAHGVPFHW